MTEFINEIKEVLKNVSLESILESDSLKPLVEVCYVNGLKLRHIKKLLDETKDNDKSYDEDKLEELYDEAKESNIKTTLKDLENHLHRIFEEKQIIFEKKPIYNVTKYTELKKYFEEKEGWSKFNHPAFYGKVIKKDSITSVEKEDNPKTYFENKEFSITYKKEEKKVTEWYNFFELWKKDPEIKTYDRIVFDPTRSNENDLNLFSDYCSTLENESAKEVEINRVLEHIKSICGYDDACYEYFLNYVAHIVQKPEQRTDVAIVMYGREGIGKNLILQLIGDCIGSQYYGESSEPRDLFGQFATGMFRRIMFVYDESDKKDTSGFMNRLKTLVTGRKLRVELKGKDSYEVDNYCRLFFPTNSKEPFPITKGNRRWFYLKGSNKYISLPDEERFNHFESLATHFKNKNVIYSFCKFLMERNIRKFNPNNFPKSEGLQQAVQVPLILRCFHSCILNNKFKASNVYSASKLLEIVIKYCKDNNYSFNAYNPTTLGSELQEYIDNNCINKKRTSAGIVYQFDVTNFNAYIKKNAFNLDDISNETEEMTIENMVLQIEQHYAIISDLKNKMFLKFSKSMGHDPIDEGIDKKDQSIKQNLDTKTIQKNLTKNLKIKEEKTTLVKTTYTIKAEEYEKDNFQISFD